MLLKPSPEVFRLPYVHDRFPVVEPVDPFPSRNPAIVSTYSSFDIRHIWDCFTFGFQLTFGFKPTRVSIRRIPSRIERLRLLPVRQRFGEVLAKLSVMSNSEIRADYESSDHDASATSRE